MDSMTIRRCGALIAACGAIAALAVPRLHAASSDDSTASAAAGSMVAFSLPSTAPKGALRLLTSSDDVRANWYQRYTHDPAGWSVGAGGAATPDGHDITSRQEFGDSYVHAEFRCPADASGNQEGSGNSGVGLQGRYEVQILGDYGQKPEAHGCGSLYSQTPPRVNASKKAGEWQTFDASGKQTENARATVFQNGVLVQNNQEFTGMTGIQYGEYKDMTPTGPLVLQGDHDRVQFRNVWIVPM